MVTIDCVGSRLCGYLDGIPIFAVDDEALARGRIGLYCWNNAGARFNDLVVAAPAWMRYYTFDEDEQWPAGTRIRVWGGSESASHETPGGVLARFGAALGEEGMLMFGTDSVRLRVRTPSVGSGHTHEFLAPSNWVTVAPRVLRKADGTAFFLLIPSMQPPGSALNAGAYRLCFTYRRNNTALDPTSQVLRMAGDSSSELVTIDVPWKTA
jgi:hypothetical protein